MDKFKLLLARLIFGTGILAVLAFLGFLLFALAFQIYDVICKIGLMQFVLETFLFFCLPVAAIVLFCWSAQKLFGMKF